MIFKKLAAILMLLSFLFNLVGYRGLFYYAQRQSDKQLASSLDKDDYNDEDLITIKVPLPLPYLNDIKEFERVDGEINFNGKIYRYVKRKVENGEYILLCLPDNNKMRIQQAKDDFYKYANDLVQHNGSKKSGDSKAGAFKNILGDYDDYIRNTATFFANDIARSYEVLPRIHLLFTPHTSPEQPPDLG